MKICALIAYFYIQVSSSTSEEYQEESNFDDRQTGGGFSFDLNVLIYRWQNQFLIRDILFSKSVNVKIVVLILLFVFSRKFLASTNS